MSTSRVGLADHSFVSFKRSNTRMIGSALFALAADEVIHCTRDQKTSCQVTSSTQHIDVVGAVACAERGGQQGSMGHGEGANASAGAVCGQTPTPMNPEAKAWEGPATRKTSYLVEGSANSTLICRCRLSLGSL
jgi:hypothetical protein